MKNKRNTPRTFPGERIYNLNHVFCKDCGSPISIRTFEHPLYGNPSARISCIKCLIGYTLTINNPDSWQEEVGKFIQEKFNVDFLKKRKEK